MSNIILHPIFSDIAIPYFIDILKYGGCNIPTIEKTLLNGNFYSCAPDYCKFSKLKDFKIGGIFEVKKIKFENFIYQKIENTSKEISNIIFTKIKNLAINFYFHEPLLNEEELKIKNKVFTKIDDFLYIKYSDVKDCDSINKIINSSLLNWHFLLLLNENNNIFSFEQMVNESKIIVVGAYDGESFLLWEKTNS